MRANGLDVRKDAEEDALVCHVDREWEDALVATDDLEARGGRMKGWGGMEGTTRAEAASWTDLVRTSEGAVGPRGRTSLVRDRVAPLQGQWQRSLLCRATTLECCDEWRNNHSLLKKR